MNRRTAALSWSMARARLGGLVAVAGAVVGGAAMVTVSVVLAATALTSHVEPDRLASADLVVAARQQHPVAEDLDIPLTERVPVPAEAVAQVAQVPGVADVAADVSLGVVLTETGACVDVHSWDVAALGHPALDGDAPRGSRDLVLDTRTADAAGLERGDTATLSVFGEAHRFRVTGIVDTPDATLLVSADTATELLARTDGAVDLLAVTVVPGADPGDVAEAVETALARADLDLVVVTGQARGDAETIAVGAARGELLALAASLAGTLTILIGCLTAAATSVSVANQRRDLALLRALGATPRQVRRVVANQASIVSLVAVLPGLALGYAAARSFAGRLASGGMLPPDLPVAMTPLAAPIVAVLMIATVQVAARCAALRASRMPATEAVSESQVEPRSPSRARTVTGLVLIASAAPQALLPLFWRDEVAFAASATGTLVGIIGIALAGPALVRTVTARAVRRLGPLATAPTWLALHHLRAYSLRTAGSVTVLALAIGLTVAQTATAATLESTVAAEREAGTVADLTVTGPLGPRDLDELADEPGVDAAVGLAPTQVLRSSTTAGDVTTTAYPAIAIGRDASRVLDPGVTRGNLDDLRGATVALSSQAARQWGAAVGDPIELILDNGRAVSPTVVAIYDRGLGFTSVLLSTDLLRQHGDPRWFDTTLVRGEQAAVASWAAGRPEVSVGHRAAIADDDSEAAAQRTINLFVLLPMLLYVLLAVANNLAASTGRRRHELASLRVVGMTRRQVLAMVRREAVLSALLAVAVGALVAVVPAALLGLGFLGQPWPHGPWWVFPGIAVLVTLMAVVTTTAAARQALRTPAATVLAAQD